jgi:hypothetical protein
MTSRDQQRAGVGDGEMLERAVAALKRELGGLINDGRTNQTLQQASQRPNIYSWVYADKLLNIKALLSLNGRHDGGSVTSS